MTAGKAAEVVTEACRPRRRPHRERDEQGDHDHHSPRHRPPPHHRRRRRRAKSQIATAWSAANAPSATVA